MTDQPDPYRIPEPASSDDSAGGTTRRTILIAVMVAIVAAAIASGVTARLIGNQGGSGDQDAELAELRAQASAQASAHAAAVEELQATGSEQADTIDALNDQVTALAEQSEADAARLEEIQAEKVALEEQLDQLLNPPAGRTPTATVDAFWVLRYGSSASVAVCVELANTSDADVDVYYSIRTVQRGRHGGLRLSVSARYARLRVGPPDAGEGRLDRARGTAPR